MFTKTSVSCLPRCSRGTFRWWSGASLSDLGSLTEAFLAAGVPSVVGSLWQVSDTSTTLLMLDFYQRFLENGSGEALRQAQLALRKSHPHPYCWGAFVLYGWDK